MKPRVEPISHSRQDEAIEAKALWFQSLTLHERMALLCEYTDLALTANPKLLERKGAQPSQGRVLVLTTP